MISEAPTRLASSATASRACADKGVVPDIPGWQLVHRLGGGGLTEVFQARPPGSPALHPAGYAVKALSARTHQPAAAYEFLCREAQAARQVESPHVVPLLAANLRQTPYFIVMPFLPGASLAELLASDSRLVLPVALWIARQVAQALDAMHAAGWLHGDIKPSNVMVAPSGHATLIDLGFARRFAESSDAWPAERPLTGSLNYLAPELLTSRIRVDVRSDLSRLGVMLYEMLAGRVPFSAADPAELVRQQREERPQDLRVVAPQLPERIARLVHSLLAKSPSRRPSACRDVVDRLAALEIQTFAERTWEHLEQLEACPGPS